MEKESKARLSAYLDGALGEEERVAMEESIATDDGLRAELEALKAIDAPLKALPEPEAPAAYFDSFASRLGARLDAEPGSVAANDVSAPTPAVATSTGAGLFMAAAAAAPAVAPAAGGPGKDESGLKDLKQLAERAATRTSADDLPSIAALSALTGRPSVTGMRVRMPKEGTHGGPPPWLWWTLSGLGLAAVVVIVMAVKIINRDPAPMVVAVNQPPAVPPPAALSPAAPAASEPEPVPAPAAAAPDPASAAPEAKAVGAAPAAAVGEPADDRIASVDKADSRRSASPPAVAAATKKSATAGARSSSPAKAEAPATPAEAAAPAVAEKPAAAGKTGDLDSLLDGAMGRGGPKVEADTASEPAGKAGKGAKGTAAKEAAAKEAATTEEAGAPLVAKEVGEEDLKKVLDGLSPRMRMCFKKFQIGGTAEVTVVVAPSGKAQSSVLKGDFLETPTGECVMGVLKSASYPSFKGGPLTVSHSYPLR